MIFIDKIISLSLQSMVTLEQFKDNAKQHGICEMLNDWDNARSKKALMDVALSIRGIEYITRAIAEGWGISPIVIEEEFKPFLNGRYKRSADGYTSSLYCGFKGDTIKIDTTVTLVIGFNGTIVPPVIGELYLCNCKDIRLQGDGAVLAYLYNSNIVSTDKCEVRIKENKRYGR